MSGNQLERGLQVLGEVLAQERLQADLALIGGGALLLLGQLARPTADLDIVARLENGVLEASQPLPAVLVRAIRRVGAALDLPHVPRDTATDPQRGSRRLIDVADLKTLAPTLDELRHALRWCVLVDGRPEFLRLDATPLLVQLGVDAEPLVRELEGGR